MGPSAILAFSWKPVRLSPQYCCCGLSPPPLAAKVCAHHFLCYSPHLSLCIDWSYDPSHWLSNASKGALRHDSLFLLPIVFLGVCACGLQWFIRAGVVFAPSLVCQLQFAYTFARSHAASHPLCFCSRCCFVWGESCVLRAVAASTGLGKHDF